MAPQWWRALVGVALLGLAVTLYLRRDGAQLADGVIAVPIFAVGVVLMWSPLETAVAGDARRPNVAHLFSREAWLRVVLGCVVVVGVMWWFATWRFTENTVVRAVVVPVAIVVAVALVLAPWWMRLFRQVHVEREQRVREFERAEIAAHLHDSVLQTLTLIRAKAHDPEAVARLARAQERDLRAYLYQGRRTSSESVATALQDAVSEVEDRMGVVVEVVTVGDGPTTPALAAAVQATREAVHNAARHGNAPYTVFAELTAQHMEVFVRDAGPGFDPDAVPGERLGIRQSIMGRVARHGGAASIASTPGRPTEVHLRIPRELE